MYTAARRGLRCAPNEPAKFIAGRRRAHPKSATRSLHASPSRNLSIFPWNNTTGSSSNNPNQEHAALWNPEKNRWEPLNTSQFSAASTKGLVNDGGPTDLPDPSNNTNGTEDKEKNNNYGSAFRRSQRNKKSVEIPPFTVPFEFLSDSVRRHKLDGALTKGFLHLSGLERDSSDNQVKETGPNAVETSPAVQPLPQLAQEETLVASESDREAILVKFYASFQECCKLYEQMQEVYGPPGEEAKNWEELPDKLSEMPNLATKWHHHSSQFEEIAGEAFAAFPNGELPQKVCADLELSNDFAVQISEMEAALHHDQPQPKPSKSETPTPHGPPDYLPQYFLNHNVFQEVLASISAGLDLPYRENQDPLYQDMRHLKLLCPIDGGTYFLDKVIEEAASRLGADITVLDPQDISEMVADFIGDGPDEATQAFSALSFEASRPYHQHMEMPPAEEDIDDEEEADADEETGREHGFPPKFQAVTTIPLSAVPPQMQDVIKKLLSGGNPFAAAEIGMHSQTSKENGSGSNPMNPKVTFTRKNELKLGSILEKIVGANLHKREWLKLEMKKILKLLQSRIAERGSQLEEIKPGPNSSVETSKNNSTRRDNAPLAPVSTEAEDRRKGGADVSGATGTSNPKTIIVLRNIKEIMRLTPGAELVSKIVNIIDQRRQNGSKILLVGTSSSSNLGSNLNEATFPGLQKAQSSQQFRALVVTPDTNRGLYYQDERRRFREINGRHFYRVLTRMEPKFRDPWKKRGSKSFADLLHRYLRNTPHGAYLEEKAIGFDDVQRIVFTALGQRSLDQDEPKGGFAFQFKYIAAALDLLKKSDEVKSDWARDEYQLQNPSLETEQKETASLDAKLKKLRKTSTPHEKNLLRGVINPENIRTTFDDVHCDPETIETLKNLTTLSLTRPEAFKYGVLAKDKISGLLLYGPPGTGKTLLAKAVAKLSGATMLEVSGSDVYDMYVGEGEKNVRAVFSLAKKLAPCVVFIDEADAIFASRSSGTNRNSHRELINQFLREWDGMNETSAFIMVATNRPFDLDDAALRRLPRRLLVDLPSEKDREAILRIHLKDEQIDGAVSIAKLASQTPLYSGSDLKNVAVAAAITAVREENDEAAKHTGNDPYKYPEKRTLYARHFDKAMEEISASINEDMSSLGAIRKFDEKYGDRRGRRKKASYGFSAGGVAKEETAKVRT